MNVSPTISIYDSLHCARVDSEFSRQSRNRIRASATLSSNKSTRSSAYLADALIGKLGIAMAAAKVMATFFGHVLHVFGLSPKEKMVRIDTCSYVATMEYLHSFWNWPTINNPCYSVGFFGFPDKCNPISRNIFCTRPQPASIALFEIQFESLYEANHKRIISKRAD